jgi:uncharacterized protein
MSQSKNTPTLPDIISKLKPLKAILKNRWSICELAVFGSVSRGDATPENDVDILFDYEKPMGLEIVTMGDFLEAELRHKVNLLSKKAVRPQVWAFIQQEMCYV